MLHIFDMIIIFADIAEIINKIAETERVGQLISKKINKSKGRVKITFSFHKCNDVTVHCKNFLNQ